MKRYPVYRDSGLAFVEKIPQHWEAKRAKYCFYEVDERSETGDEELLSVSHITGVTPRSEKNITMFMAESYEGYKTCIPNDLVINIMWAWMGALGVSKYQGIISSAYGVYRQKNTNKFYSDYLEYLVRIPEYIAEYTRTSKGIRSSRLRMYSDDFFQIPIICPLLEEQKTITRFLDRKLEQISHFISNKQRLIELLKEQKTAIVNHAFTKGFNPNAPMKPSGTKFLGSIPEHWEIKKLKKCIKYGTSISYGILQPGNQVDDGVPFIQTTNMTQGNFEISKLQRTDPSIAAMYPRSTLQPGDIMLGIRATIGDAHIVPSHLSGANLSRGVARIVPSQEISANFLVNYLRSAFVSEYWKFSKQGTTFSEVSIATVKELPILIPSLFEQNYITELIDKKLRPIDRAIAKIEKEIELIQEYRTTLISDAVTGKIDVRETSVVESTLTAAAI
ncbi:restriction endonuclease subunit S [Nostoc sp.]|uniref:restriction endonuclease subunit S n=1 Tax=Nostoc sp. TaxID=1180 RepID=UPI002FF9A497